MKVHSHNVKGVGISMCASVIDKPPACFGICTHTHRERILSAAATDLQDSVTGICSSKNTKLFLKAGLDFLRQG